MSAISTTGPPRASAASADLGPDASTVSVRRVASRLRSARNAVVVGHVNPDGDALGSATAIAAALTAIGVPATVTWGGRSPEEPPAAVDGSWTFLPSAGGGPPPTSSLPADLDVLVVCDCGSADRLGTLGHLIDAADTVVVIDHHAVGRPFGDLRVIDPAASSTGALALGLIDALDVPLTAAMADALYLAVMTDTGRFTFSATTPADHRVAARLIEAGADHTLIAQAVYESAGVGFLDLVARVTARVVLHEGVLLASWVTRDDLVETGATEGEVDGLLDVLRRVRAAPVTALLREGPDASWRTSLRSRGRVDVAQIAAELGGGGHRMAAGCRVGGDATSVIDRIATMIRTRHDATSPSS